MSTNPSHSTRALLLKIADGDAHAYRQFFNRYWNRIYQVAFQLLKTREEAKDAVQIVFARLWEKRAMLTEVENPDSWLFIMARNTMLNMLKQQANARHSGMEEVLPEDGHTPAMQLEYKQTDALIQEAIAQLPPQQSLIFRLSREQGLTHPQIASKLKIAPATVKSHIIRALSYVRAYVRKQGGYLLITGCLFLKYFF